MLKPELWIRFLPVSFSTDQTLPDETVAKKFKLSDKVSAVKGWAVERLKGRLFSDALIDKDQIIVMRGGERLKDNQLLIDLVFPRTDLTVTYSKEGISFRDCKAFLELEPDLFSMFD